MNNCLNIQEALDPIKLFFFSDFQTKEFKEYIRLKIRRLSPYQFYHFLAWLLENVKDDAILSNLDVLFDFSILNPKKYLPTEEQTSSSNDQTVKGAFLPDLFEEDCIEFFHMDFGTMNFLHEGMISSDRIHRFLFYFKARKAINRPQVNYERLLNLMSLEERLCFPVYSFPDLDTISFYGHALNFLKRCVDREAEGLKYSLTEEIEKEGNKIKKLFIGKRMQELPYAIMDRSVLLWPMLAGFEIWKRLVIDALKNKELFNVLKTKLLFSIEELKELLGEDYFQNVTAKSRGYMIKDEETGNNFLKSYSPPIVQSTYFSDWLKNLKVKDLTLPIEKEIEDTPKNQIIISKKGSQRRLKKALTEFFSYLKLRVDDEHERAMESFLYRNFSFENDDKVDFSKRTVNNFGYKPLDFIPAKHAKDFAKLLLYLSDKNYLHSNKTQIIRTLDEDIHEKNGKDGFSYSSLIRIPSDEHHLFPDREIRRRIRSILKIDD
ncbi:MAG: hypothetical protein GY931_14440 [Maribacter sp.]|nr:hypothetical protein [Maribacter sp.]